VPGATISGFILPSEVGPLEEKEATSAGLSASLPYSGLRFSEAPTVRGFVASPGLAIVPLLGPALPAAKTKIGCF